MQRQLKIYSRMLEATRSLQRKDYNDQRQAQSAESNKFYAPPGLTSELLGDPAGLEERLRKYLGDDYQYVYFEIPLSFFDYTQAQTILKTAINELLPLPTDVSELPSGQLPERFSLSQNYPNPFNPTTSFEFNLPAKSEVKIEVFNIIGQNVATLLDKEMAAGSYKVEWDGKDNNGTDVSTGIYLYRLSTNHYVSTKKMMLIK